MRRLRRNEDAVVLVLTVLVLSILVILGFAFSYGAGVNASAAANARETFANEAAADSALAWATALLDADLADGTSDAMSERWARDDLTVVVGGRKMAVRISDENRKLNVNRAAGPPTTPKDPDLRPALKRLISNLGGSPLDYERLCRWVVPGASEGRRPLLVIEGLAAVPDLDKGLLAGGRDKPPLSAVLTTVSDRVNVNTAGKDVLDALWDNPTLTQNVMNARRQAPFRDDAQVEAYLAKSMGAGDAVPAAAAVGVASEWFRIEARPAGGRGGAMAIVRRTSAGAQTQSARRLSEEDGQ